MSKKKKEEVKEVVEEEGQNEGQDNPTPKGDSEVTDDRPERNWKAELDRKVGERDKRIEELKAQIDTIKENQNAQKMEKEKDALREELEEYGYGKEIVDVMDKTIQKRIKQIRAETRAEVAQEITPLKEQLYSSSKDRYLNEIKRDDDTGMVKDNFDDIKGVIDKLDPSVWKSRESMQNAVDMVIGGILRKDPSSIKKSKSSSPTEDNPSPAPSKKAKKAKKSSINKAKEQLNVEDDVAAEVAAASDELDKQMY